MHQPEFGEHWQIRPRVGRIDDFAHACFFSVLRFEGLFEERRIPLHDCKFVLNGTIKAVDSAPNWEVFQEAVSAGHTVIADQIHVHDTEVGRIASSLQQRMGFVIQEVGANAYFTPPNARGFLPHYDPHDTLIVQIHGSKHWKVWGNPLPLPFRDELSHRTIREAVEHCASRKSEIDLTLAQGDWLYLPRGFIHAASTTTTESLHVTFGFDTVRNFDVLQFVLRQAFDRCVTRTEFIRPIEMNVVDGQAVVSSKEVAIFERSKAILLDLLEESAKSISVDSLRTYLSRTGDNSEFANLGVCWLRIFEHLLDQCLLAYRTNAEYRLNLQAEQFDDLRHRALTLGFVDSFINDARTILDAARSDLFQT